MIEREFAGETRKFKIAPPDRTKLYRGLEADVGGGLGEFALRVLAKRALNSNEIIHILSHALSGGHPIGLIRARKLVIEEVESKPLADLQPIAIDIIADLYAGAGDGDP